MEPQRKRRSDRHSTPAANTHQKRADPHAFDAPVSYGSEAPEQQTAAISQALSGLAKSGGQLVSALLSNGGAAIGKLSEKVQDGSLARDFQRNDTLKQGIIFGVPAVLFLLSVGFSQFWHLLGLLAACFYLWRYQLGQLRRTRWDYLLLIFPLVHMIASNVPLLQQLAEQVTQMAGGRGYYNYGITPPRLRVCLRRLWFTMCSSFCLRGCARALLLC